MNYVYLLSNGKKTYIGATKTPDKRLRQHNRELVGGAKATHGSTWERILLISGLPNWRTALQLEWAWKYMSRKLKVRGVLGRIDALIVLLHLPRCTSKAVPYKDWHSEIFLTCSRNPVGILEKIERWSNQKSEDGAPQVSILSSNQHTFLTSLSFNMSFSSFSSSEMSVLIKAIEALVEQQTSNNKLVTAVLERLASGKASAGAGADVVVVAPTKAKRGPKAKTEKPAPPPAADGTVRFGSASEGDYKEFSSFFKAPFTVGDKMYGSLAHYFHSMKFAGADDDFAEDIRAQKNPALTRSKASSVKDHSPIADWDTAKMTIMKSGLRAKFTANPALREKLISTGTAPIEATIEEEMRVKDFWSIGADGSGANNMGRLLMEIRSELDSAPAVPRGAAAAAMAAAAAKKPVAAPKKPAAAPKKPAAADSDSEESEDEEAPPVAKAPAKAAESTDTEDSEEDDE